MDMDFDLKCLPTNFVGTSKPSNVIKALNAKREAAEKQAVDELTKREREICNIYEKRIEEHSDELKKNLNKIRGLIKNELYDLKEKSNDDNANSADKFEFKQACKRIQEYTQNQHDLVEVFYLNLIKLGKDQSQDFTGVLKKTYEDIKRISFKLPNEYDELIEFKIEEANQTILCNNRNYAELKIHLQSDIQNYTKTALIDLQRIKERWVKFLQFQTENELSDVRNQYKPEFMKVVEGLSQSTRKLSSSLTKMDTVTNNLHPEAWLDNIRQTLANLDQKAQRIMINYKQAAIIIYNRFFQELKVIEEALAELNHTEQIPKAQAEMYTLTLQEIADTYDVELENIQKIWNELVKQLTETIENTYRFLLSATTVWKKHFKRTEVLQVVMLRDVQNTIKLNNALSESYETKLNVLIDTLRQESSKERLKKTIEDINKLFLTIEALYKSQYQTEVAVMKKYKNVHELKMDVLMAEIKRFLTVYPPDHEKDPKIQRKRASQTEDIMDPTEGFIPVQMLYCKYQIDAVSNWQFGVWESISNYMAVARIEISSETDKWIQGHLTRLDKRLMLRLGMHALRSKKIQAYIHDERLEELCVHQRRFEEHKSAVDRRLAILKEEYKFYQDIYETVVKNYHNEVQTIEDASINSTESVAVAALRPVLEAKTKECIEEINGLAAEYLDKCDAFFDRLKASDVVLNEHMKLFFEEGNFSIQEIKDILRNVDKLEAQVDKGIAEIRKKVGADKVTVIEKIHTRETGIHCAIRAIKEEHLFNEALHKFQKNLQKDLITEVCALQYKFNALTKEFEQSKEESMRNCGNYDSFKDFSEKTRDMAQKLIEMAEYLDETVPVRFYSDKSATELVPSGLPKDEGQRIQEITERLFNLDIPQNKNTLFLNLNKILRKYWEDMIVNARKFYIAHRRCFFLDNNKIRHSLLQLIKDQYKKFFYIQNQCETRQMQDTKEFLYFASNYLFFLEECIHFYMTEYSRKTLKHFDLCYEMKVKPALEGDKTGIKERYKELHTKLKPLYGHPKNKWILEKLQIEADIMYSDITHMLEDIRVPYLEQLKGEFNKAMENYDELKNLIPEITQVTQNLKIIVQDLSLKLKEKVNLFRMIMDHNPLENMNAIQQDITSHCKSFLTFYDSKSWPHLGDGSSFKDTRMRETSSMLSIGDEVSFEGYSLSNKSLPVSTATTIETTDMNIFQSTMKEYYDKFCREVNNANLADILNSLQEEWNCAVKRVVDLYSIKYDHLY